jgi:hypothetical protein
MRGSLLLNFDEIVSNKGEESVTVRVNGVVRKITTTECENEYMTFINVNDVVQIELIENPEYTGTTKEIKVVRRDFTIDNEDNDFGIKNTFIQEISGTTNTLTTTFTATTRSDAYNFHYIITAESCNTPVLTSSLTPPATCSNSTFNYTPTVSLVGSTYTWTRNVVSGISNPASSGSGVISETLINTTNAAISVPYLFDLFAIPNCTAQQTVTEVINPRPSISNQTISLCSENSFTVSPTNGGGNIVPLGTTYTWTVSSNSNLTGQSNQPVPQSSISQTITNITVTSQTLVYTVTPVSPQGCVGNIFTITITVNPVIINPQSSGTIFNNQTIDMTPIATGTTLIPAGTLYTWTFTPNANVTGMTTQTVPTASITQTLTNISTSRKTITYQITAISGSCSKTYTYSVLLFANPVIEVISNPNTTSWTAPAAVTGATIECWGGGGRGGSATVGTFVLLGRSRGGGAGGGAYARSFLTITGGATYSLKIGSQPLGDTDTWFINNTTLLAKGGLNGQSSFDNPSGVGNGGGAGSALQSIGQVLYSGGNGANAGTGGNNFSGGGGGSAGSAGDGNPGIQINGGQGGIGDKPGGGVGNGGNGRINTTAAGFAGSNFGSGGGGGLCSANTSSPSGGAGVTGVIRLTYYL